jgi:hypothetical protein
VAIPVAIATGEVMVVEVVANEIQPDFIFQMVKLLDNNMIDNG